MWNWTHTKTYNLDVPNYNKTLIFIRYVISQLGLYTLGLR